MKIITEGKMHKMMAWFVECDCCESEIRILEGDPHCGKLCYNCDASQYYIRWICPVCGAKETSYTSSSFGIKANAKYKEIILTKEDREEMNEWIGYSDLFDDELEHINNRCRV